MPEEITDEQRQALQAKLKNMSPEEIAQLQREQCIFCQIISGKIPTKKIYEDELAIAIVDINPASKGHLLLLSKEHYMIMPQVPDGLLAHLFLLAKKLSQTLLRTFKVGGTTIFIANGQVAGQRAQHFMIHVIPRKEGDKLLPLNEKIITADMQEKVKNAVQAKLYKLLGFESLPAEKSEQPEKNIAAEHPKQSSGKVPKRATEKQTEKQTKKHGSAPKKTDPESASGAEQTSTRKNDDDISLDDIANLFK